MDEIPIIRIELEGMKQAMYHAFSKQLLNMDTQFKQAIDEACEPNKIQALLNKTADTYIKEALDIETKNYFLHGAGRQIIAAKVQERLAADFISSDHPNT